MRLTSDLNIFCKTILAIQKDIVGPSVKPASLCVTRRSRYPQRDATLVLVTCRHGLRAAEACDLEWSQVDFDTTTLHVRRVKNGKPATHPIRGDELRAFAASCGETRADKLPLYSQASGDHPSQQMPSTAL